MSIRLMNLAFAARIQPTQKLVLIRMADYANDAGVCWPAIRHLAEAACISERQCQRVMKSLIEDGYIEVVANHAGGRPGESRHYRVIEGKLLVGNYTNSKSKKEPLTGDTHVTPIAETGDKMTPVGVTPMTPVGVTLVTQTGDTHVTLSTIEPSVNTNTPLTPQGGRVGVRRQRKADETPYTEILEAYREHLGTLAQPQDVEEWTDKRKTAVRSRWDERPKRQSIEWWQRYFRYVAQSEFLTGKSGAGFEATFDWLMNPNNMLKVCEGNYHKEATHG